MAFHGCSLTKDARLPKLFDIKTNAIMPSKILMRGSKIFLRYANTLFWRKQEYVLKGRGKSRHEIASRKFLEGWRHESPS
ncbi:MAG: hypothetical protein A2X49_14650 [Lentisphaerae bacterium GWF2_52_8]|nr:MAG: hypothetical protein A2X49_14650 [Lentisphaerae bacterium GWF2_52_8]